MRLASAPFALALDIPTSLGLIAAVLFIRRGALYSPQALFIRRRRYAEAGSFGDCFDSSMADNAEPLRMYCTTASKITKLENIKA